MIPTKLKYRIYQSNEFPVLHNDRPRTYNLAYEDIVEIDVSAGGDPSTRVLEYLFVLHNRDDRPDGHRIRSMSVSDIVSLQDDNGNETYYMVAAIGFAKIAKSRIVGNQSLFVLRPESADGVFLSLVPNTGLPRARTADDDVFEIPMQEVVDTLVKAGSIPARPEGYKDAQLLIRHNQVALVIATTDSDEKEYPGLNVDAIDANGERIYLANVELPNADYQDHVTARLYNGYMAFESDSPSAVMATKLREPDDVARLEKYTGNNHMLRKILYVDRDQCETRTWGSDIMKEEHEYEPGMDTDEKEG